MKKIRVCLLFGGKSGEHEVSLQSAKSIYEALDKEKYDVVLVGIDKQGRWLLGDSANYLLNSEDPKLIALNKTNATPVIAVTRAEGAELVVLSGGATSSGVDVFFPITHGTYGEDGCLQGFLELLDTAYVGPGVLGSAVGMDKDVMKRLLRDAGLPVGRYLVAKEGVNKSDLFNFVKEVEWPVFVKPANLGSSVGISKVKNADELERAVGVAFQYDAKILIEENISGREIEVSVLGNDEPIASVPGEVRATKDFYSYEAKYIDEDGAVLEMPAKLTDAEIKQAQEFAIRVFQALECSGLARVDFFLKLDGSFIVNEINTLPGFTNISMYPKLWELSGVPYPELLDRLIGLALERHRKKSGLKRTFG